MWLTEQYRVGYYVPLYALTNLSISILQDPLAPTAASQANIVMVPSGYFARIEVDTDVYVSRIRFSLISSKLTVSEISRPLVPDMVQIAQNAIREAKSTPLLKTTDEKTQVLGTFNSPTANGLSLTDEHITNPQPWEANVEDVSSHP